MLRFSIEQVFTPLVLFALAVQLLQLGLEPSNKSCHLLSPIVVPFQSASIGIAFLLGVAVVGSAIQPQLAGYSLTQQALLIAACFLAARANQTGSFAILGLILTYVFLNWSQLTTFHNSDRRIEFLLEPWRSALFGFSLSVVSLAVKHMRESVPRLFAGPYPIVRDKVPSHVWILTPATILACVATLGQTANPPWRAEHLQLWAPYLGAATLALAGLAWAGAPFYHAATVLLAIANCHAVNNVAGDWLLARGLSEIHIVCFGLLFTLLQGSVVRRVVLRESIIVSINRGSIVLAFIILALLGMNYFAHPNLETIPVQRFLLSAVLALGAGLYFRRAARHPGPGEVGHEATFEGFYHFGLCIAIWCVALTIPVLRLPGTALLALGIPAAYFYARAELGLHGGPGAMEHMPQRYRNSAGNLGLLILVLYVSRTLFQMILFPGTRIMTDHYHHNAPLVILVAFMLIRLHGLRGNWWLAFYGGLAMMSGSYFCATAFPGLSPFTNPIPAAWVAVAVTHFFVLASYQRSPMRSVIQGIGHIDGPNWNDLRRYWGRCLLAASQIAILLGLRDYDAGDNSYQVAPLLLAAASILVHLAVAGEQPWYYAVAGVQGALALHADFFVPSYLPKEYVIWVLLAMWGALVLSYPYWRGRCAPEKLGPGLFVLFAGCAAHVFYHHPTSDVGLWAAGFIALCAGLTPRSSAVPENGEQRTLSALLLLAIPWLVYFSQVRNGSAPPDWLGVWPVLTTMTSIFAVGEFGRITHKDDSDSPFLIEPEIPRLYHQTFAWLSIRGRKVHEVILWATICLLSGIMVLHYGTSYDTGEVVVSCILWAASAAAWYREVRRRQQPVPFIMAQLCILGLFAVLRRQLMLTTQFWNYEYDVWCALVVSCCLTGAKSRIQQELPNLKLPTMGTLFALPVVAMIWIIVHGLGTDIALVVVGLNCLIFAFLGKDERESPYNMIAICGFVAFVILLFWSKLQFRVLHAYIIPVGIGILALVHLAGNNISRGTRERIRLVTLLAMICSTGYYALADAHYPLVFNLTMLGLCLVAMVFGSFFRVRLYLILGFAGLLTDVASIVYKVVMNLDSNYRMTTIGFFLLLVGAGVVAGSVHYKTHHDDWEARLNRLRERLGDWE